MYDFTDNNMSQYYDWDELVIDYHKHYDDEDGIHEYVDSLLPQYYSDIYYTYHQYIGTPLNIEIQEHHVGVAFWRIMNEHIFEEFMGHFMEAFNAHEEEE